MATTENQQPITGPLKWFGGKSYLADRIIELMRPHLHYVEPYFGGGSVLLAKPISKIDGYSEVVNDLNGHLINFWNVIANEDTFDCFRRMAEATPFSESLYENATAESLKYNNWYTGQQVSVPLAHAFFVRCRQSRAGQFNDFATLSRTRTRRGMNEQASAWLSAVEGLPAVHARLKRVVILNRDALDVIKQQDGAQTCFYLDPPYLHETRTGKDDYACEMTTEQHAELLALLRKIEGKFLLSGYRSDLYDKIAAEAGWNRHDFELPNNAAGGKEKRRMTECVWTNF